MVKNRSQIDLALNCKPLFAACNGAIHKDIEIHKVIIQKRYG